MELKVAMQFVLVQSRMLMKSILSVSVGLSRLLYFINDLMDLYPCSFYFLMSSSLTIIHEFISRNSNGCFCIWKRFKRKLIPRKKSEKTSHAISNDSEKSRIRYHQLIKSHSAAVSLKGPNPFTEHRCFIEENINHNTGVSLYAVFNGHNGHYAAAFAKDVLAKHLCETIVDLIKYQRRQKFLEQYYVSRNFQTNVSSASESIQQNYSFVPQKGSANIFSDDGQEEAQQDLKRKTNKLSRTPFIPKNDQFSDSSDSACDNSSEDPQKTTKHFGIQFCKENDSFDHKNSLRNVPSDSESSKDFQNNLKQRDANCSGTPFNQEDDSLKDQKSLGNIISESQSDNSDENPQQICQRIFKAKTNLILDWEEEWFLPNPIVFGKPNFVNLITHEILAFDERFLEFARNMKSASGTTALIAIVHDQELTVANVGDSEAILFTVSGSIVPLSNDPKPKSLVEKQVWKVLGTTQALGNFPLKDRNLLNAKPNFAKISLKVHEPSFLIIATRNIWSIFTKEEAFKIVLEHLHEADFGAKCLALTAIKKGKDENITVLVVKF